MKMLDGIRQFLDHALVCPHHQLSASAHVVPSTTSVTRYMLLDLDASPYS
ncbi:MAG: hypothetical protein V5B44_04640 [Candidatus Accumulibacter necessarius]